MGKENIIFDILSEKIRHNTLVLPTLPDVALKVRDLANDPNINLKKISKVISIDPSLSIGIIKVSNTALFGRSVKIETISQATTRIGLNRIKSIATAMAIKQMFNSENAVISMYLKKSWKQTVDIASVAIALFIFYEKENRDTPLNIDTLTLSSLTHNIGVLPILKEAEEKSELFANPNFIKSAIISLSTKIGIKIVESWNFSNIYHDVISSWANTDIYSEKASYIDFIRAGALYHNVFSNQNTQDVLLDDCIKKGIIPDAKFLSSDEFKKMVTEIKTMFS
jgi:HD-like signal output (HDOD) protein